MSYNLKGLIVKINGAEQIIVPGTLPVSPANGHYAIDSSDGKLKVYNAAKSRWIVLGDAEDIVFNNSTNGFVSTNVQAAIEEAKTIPAKRDFIQFQYIGTMNSDLYLYSQVDQGSGLLSSFRPSGNASNGYRYSDCAPVLNCIGGKAIKINVAIQGAAVSTGSPAGTVNVRLELWSVGMTNEGTKLADINVPIASGSFTIGTFWNSSVDTNFIGSVVLNVAVSENQLLALKFNSITGNSNAVSIQNITAKLEVLEQ